MSPFPFYRLMIFISLIHLAKTHRFKLPSKLNRKGPLPRARTLAERAWRTI